MALSGAAWGCATFLLGPTVNGVDQAIVILFISGFVAGAAAAFAGDRLSFAAFSVPAVAIPFYNLMAHGDPVAQKIAAVLAFFLVFLLASAERGHRARKGEFSIQIERERLSAALTAEKEKFKDLAAELDARVQTRTGQLTELNEKLQAEVFERGEAERAARSQKARFTAAFENAPVGMIIAYQATGEIVKANSAVCELLGYKTAELAKMRLVSLLCPSESEHGTTDLFASDSSAERRFIHRRGHVIWGRTSIGAMSGDEFTDGYVVIQIQDLTELKSAHDKLSSRDGAFGAAFESTPTPTAILDACGRITNSNPRMRTLLGAAYGSEASDVALATLVESDDKARIKLADFFSGRVGYIEASVTLFANLSKPIDTMITVARVGEGTSETAFAVLHIDVSHAEISALEDGSADNVVTLEPRNSVFSNA